MACPQQNNIGAKRTEKLMKYRQLAFETKEYTRYTCLQNIRVSCRRWSIGRYYKSTKDGLEEDF